jgi:hypothetical protein
MKYSCGYIFLELRNLILTPSENTRIVPPIPVHVFPDSSFFDTFGSLFLSSYAVELDEFLDKSYTFHLYFQALPSLSAEALHQRD